MFGRVNWPVIIKFLSDKRKFKKIISSKFVISVLFVLLSLIISVCFSIDPSYSLKKLLDILLVMLFASGLFMFLDNIKPNQFNILLATLCGFMILELVYLYYDMFLASDAVLEFIHGKENVIAGRVRYPANQMIVFFL